MNTLHRHTARGVLLLPAHQTGRGDPQDDHAEMSPDARQSRQRIPSPAGNIEPESPTVRVAVRGARALDAFGLARFDDRSDLNHPGSTRADGDPVRTVLRDLLPFVRHDRPVFVATSEEDRRLLGFVQFRVVGPDQRWLAESIAADAGVYAPEPVVAEMLRHAVTAAGLHGAKRIYAHLEPDSPFQAPFRELGFSPFTRQRILMSSNVPVMPGSRGVRVQEQADVWAIHQLYMHSTPRDVQYAEALTSHSWDVQAMWRDSGHGCRGWIIADDHLATGYARAVSRRDAHIVDFMLSPERRQDFPRLVSAVFKELSALPSRRVYVVVRDYQSEYISYLHELGFAIEEAQEVHIKYTVARMRSSVLSPSFATEPVKDPAARRVPTFYGGPVDTFSKGEE